MTDDPHSVMLGVWRGDDLIADGSLNSLPRRMSHRAELGITVKKAHWNQGIGSMLMERLIQYAKENGIELIYLEVRDYSDAVKPPVRRTGNRLSGMRKPPVNSIGAAEPPVRRGESHLSETDGATCNVVA